MTRTPHFRRLSIMLLFASLAGAGDAAAQALHYPPAARGPVVDDYFGTKVPDPYRWLEDVDSPATRQWIDAENLLSEGFLSGIPQRPAIERRLTALWNYARFGAPFHRGTRYFFFKNDGLQNQSVLYQQSSLTGPATVLLDPNTLSADGTVALSTLEVSDDGRLLAYATSASGSDWQDFHVKDVQTGRDMPEVLRWSKFSGASWTRDGQGFFYSRYPEPTGGNAMLGMNHDQKLYYHVVGTGQAADRLVYERPDHPDWGIGAEVTEDGRYAILTLWVGTDRRNRVAYLDLHDPVHPSVSGKPAMLLDAFDAGYSFVGNDGPVFYFVTDNDAPRRRVIAVDTRTPMKPLWKTVIPEGPDVIESVHLVHNQFVVAYLQDAHSRLALYGRDGVPAGTIDLPTLGTVSEITGRRGDSELFFSFTSFLYPSTVFRHDFTNAQTTIFKAPQLPFDPSGYETEQVFYAAKDGVRIPMFITHKKGMLKNGTNPTYLYGYGGFDISLTPAFSPAVLVWLEMGGVYAVPNLRGGGEYGEAWHEAGMLEKKQTVFDDFIAAAEYLIGAGYTSRPRLAIGGGSNGGLLVGAVMTQRPDLFAATLPAVGVMDMLRFQKFTIGWAWVSEYGSSDSASQFPFLYKYSPLHNLKPGIPYPATLITTADHDDRVVPGHSFKFAAALQAAQGVPAPVLIRIETKAGHGAGKPTAKLIEEQADRWAFLVHALQMTPTLP